MESKPVPFRRTVFVCAHARNDGKRVSCADEGRDGAKVLEALKLAVKERGLRGKVRVVKSHCLDVCEKGPSAFCFPEGEWLCGLSEKDIPALVERFCGGA